jgi:hypothetical protein
MANPFDTGNASIFGDYIQLSGSDNAARSQSAPTGSSRGLAFIFASSSTGLEADTKLYILNATGAASPIATEADSFNFTVAGDSGPNQEILDGNTLTFAGDEGLEAVASATDTVTFKIDIDGMSTALTAVADADLFIVDDGASGANKKITRGDILGSSLAAFDNGLTSTTITSSQGVLVNDDKFVYFGNDEDASIRFDSGASGGGAFIVSGSATGVAMQGSLVPTPVGGAAYYNLGAPTSQWKDLYVDGEAHIDALGQALDANSQNITNAGNLYGGAVSGSVSVTGGAAGFASAVLATAQVSDLTDNRIVIAGASGELEDSANLTYDGSDIVLGDNVDLGSATTDSITFTGRADSDLLPITDSAHDLGSSALQWAELHVDTGNIDQLGSALDANSQNITNAGNLYGDAVSGSVSVQGGAATFASAVLASAQVSDLTDNRIVIAGASGELEDSANFTYDGSDIVLGDNVDLGAAITDSITFTGRVDSDVLPIADNTHDLGSATNRYAQAHVAEAHLDTLGQALDANSQNITNAGNLFGSAVSGSVSVAGGAGTLVTLGVAGATPSGDVALALPDSKDVQARAFVTYSERSLKTNIQPMNNALDTVKKMQGVTYDLKNSGKNEVGFIADEMAQVVPEVVSFHADGRAAGLDYGRLTSVLVEAIKAQQAQIEELMSKLNK